MSRSRTSGCRDGGSAILALPMLQWCVSRSRTSGCRDGGSAILALLMLQWCVSRSRTSCRGGGHANLHYQCCNGVCLEAELVVEMGVVQTCITNVAMVYV